MRNLFWVFAALVVMSGIASTNLWRDLRAERAQAASLQTQLDEAGRANLAMPTRSAAVVSSAAASPATTAAPANAPPTAAAGGRQPTDAATLIRNMENEQRELWKDPEYRKARLAQMRTNAQRNNPGLAEELGISQAEADKVLDVLAQYDLDINSSMSLLASAANDAAASQEMARKQQQAQRQRDEGVAALLGPAGAGKWQQYQQNATTRSRVASINSTLSQGGQGLSVAQQKSLAAALGPETQALSQEMTALARDINTQDPAARAQFEELLRKRQEESNQRMLAAAAPVLSVQQLAALRTQFEQQQAMNRAAARARERAAVMQGQGGGQ